MKEERMRLLVTDGPCVGQRFEVSGDEVWLGRATSCHVSLRDPEVSRHHCLVKRVDGIWKVWDIDSVNGTRLNGKVLRSASAPIAVGDRIAVGKTLLAVVALSEPQPTEVRKPRWSGIWDFRLKVAALAALAASVALAAALAGNGGGRRPQPQSDCLCEIPNRPEERQLIMLPTRAPAARRNLCRQPVGDRGKGTVQPSVAAPTVNSPEPQPPAATSEVAARREVAATSEVAETGVVAKREEALSAFVENAEVVVANVARPLRGMLVEGPPELVTLAVRPGVEYSIPRRLVRQITKL